MKGNPDRTRPALGVRGIAENGADPVKVSQAVIRATVREAAFAVVSKIAYTVEEACASTGIGVTTLYAEAKEGHLEMGKLRGRTVIRAEELRRWFDSRYHVIEKRR